ncbi:hypothetical protein GF312_06810, partial [Candidatus Poribacteria bacterium]|nr:hypothetical protein [Candidatus Poribacteria bacterium]
MYWRRIIVLIVVLAFAQLIIFNNIYAAETQKETKGENARSKLENKIVSKEENDKPKFIGFVDENRDGINDKFQDLNGDGINDVTKEKYKHLFKFIDKNKDKINDLFTDKDGDGVNDLGTEPLEQDKKDELNINVVDFNKDGINDITGLKYKRKDIKDVKDLMGYRYGIVEEERKKIYEKFIDEDGDGMHDPIARRLRF